MYICIARIRKNTSVNETLTTGKQVGFQSPSKLFWSNSWIARTTNQLFHVPQPHELHTMDLVCKFVIASYPQPGNYYLNVLCKCNIA